MDAEMTIRLFGATLVQLQELAAWSGVTVEEALARAVARQHGERARAAAIGGYAGVRADAGAKRREPHAKRSGEAVEQWHDEGGGD